jgi:ribosomal protein S27AE
MTIQKTCNQICITNMLYNKTGIVAFCTNCMKSSFMVHSPNKWKQVCESCGYVYKFYPDRWGKSKLKHYVGYF